MKTIDQRKMAEIKRDILVYNIYELLEYFEIEDGLILTMLNEREQLRIEIIDSINNTVANTVLDTEEFLQMTSTVFNSYISKVNYYLSEEIQEDE